jgi:uncharacterized protein
VTTTVSNNVATIQAIYEAFGRGDLPAILEAIAEDVEWEAWDDNHGQKAGVPWLEPRKGRDAVPGFFGVIGQWTLNRFDVLSLMDGGDRVAAEVEADFGLPNGNRLVEQEIHLWKFNGDGKVILFRHYVDTAKHIKAAGI